MATYYVSTSGSDSNVGSQAAPWAHAPGMTDATGNPASTTLQPGDSVLFKKGDTFTAPTFSGYWLHITASGADGSPITLGNYGTGALPIIDGNAQGAWQGIIYIDNASYITLDGLDIPNSGMYIVYGLGASYSNIVLRNCIFRDNAAGQIGVFFQGADVTGGLSHLLVEDNVFSGIGHDALKFSDGVDYAIIRRNTITTTGHNAIDSLTMHAVAYSRYAEIYENDIYGIIVEDSGAAGMYLPSLLDSVIHSNKVHDFVGVGICVTEQDLKSQRVTIRNNVLYNLTGSGKYAIWINDSDYTNVWNNTIYGCNCPDIQVGATHYSYENNLARECSNYAYEISEFGSDPLFVDPIGIPPDFHLQVGSPAIDQGVDVGLPFLGNAPDLGAFEYTPMEDPVGTKLFDEQFENPAGYDESAVGVGSDWINQAGAPDPNYDVAAVAGAPSNWATECLHIVAAGAACQARNNIDTAQPTIYLRFSFILHTISTLDTTILLFSVGGPSPTYMTCIWLQGRKNTGGDPYVTVLVDGTASGVNYTIALDTSYLCEFKYDSAANSFEWKMNGVSIYTTTATDAGKTLVFGSSTAAHQYDLFVDNFAWGTDGWLGDEPSGSGSYSDPESFTINGIRSAMVSLNAIGTATLFAAPGAGFRMHIQKGLIIVPDAIAGMQVTVKELLTTGTSSANWVFQTPRGKKGFYSFNFGEKGLCAVESDSRFIVQVEGADGPATVISTGYVR